MVIIALPDGEQQVVVTLRDISDRKEAIERIREIDSRFRQLVDHIPEAFFLIPLQGNKILYASPACERIFGSSGQVLYEDPDAWRKFVFPEDQRSIDQLFEQDSADHAEAEVRIRFPDGTPHWIHIMTFPVTDGAGKNVARGIIAGDISDRKHIEEAFREALMYNRTLIEILPEPILFLDRQGVIQDLNPALERISGWSRNHLIGTPVSGHFKDPAVVATALEGVFECGQMDRFPSAFIREDGSLTDVTLDGVLYWDAGGNIVGILIMVLPEGKPADRTA
jgi:PAS domain S-box-containing protein